MGILRLLLFIFFVSLCSEAWAQRSQELTLSWGATHMMADVGPAGINMPQSGSWDLDYRIQAHPHYAFHLGYSEGSLEANDAQSTWIERQQRNFHVQTPFRSLQARMEVDFFPQRIPSFSFQHSPYLFAGMGLMTFEPRGYYQGEWIALQPLGTEGQGTSVNPEARYATRARTLPFGLGWRAQVNAMWVVTMEATWTQTTSDYLDDVHGRYADVSVIQENYGDAAAYFADPSGLNLPAGMARGDAQTRDAYFILRVGMGLHLEAFMEKCSSFLHR